MGRCGVWLGSSSVIKRQAVQRAFGERLCELRSFSAESGVPSQPIGRAQTRQGALNRALHAITLAKESGEKWDNAEDAVTVFAVGVENGIWRREQSEEEDRELWETDEAQDREGWVDVACVCAVPLSFTCGDCEGGSAVFLFSEELDVPRKSERSFAGGDDGEWSELKVRKSYCWLLRSTVSVL